MDVEVDVETWMCTSSRLAECVLDRSVAAEDRVVAEVDGLAAVFFFLSVLGLSRDSSTVASAHHHHKPRVSLELVLNPWV